ncbi:MAG TPA: hypothetical protein VMK12_13975, partial [Anaeromyxobacteraceae bacterium]|nr:hypothetical protein [Anaeromyxobacteraceae bacterium]
RLPLAEGVPEAGSYFPDAAGPKDTDYLGDLALGNGHLLTGYRAGISPGLGVLREHRPALQG